MPLDAHGYLAVDTDRGPREYVLGPRNNLETSPPMLDWRTAPLAEVFFRHRVGESYELDTGATGRVTARRVVGDTIATAPSPALVPPRLAAPIELDAEQQRAVDLPADTSLVIDGEAGVGKTLVALYRIASLAARARAAATRFRALVLVPTEGLRRLVRLLADRLGLDALEIAVLDPWLVERARAAFPGLPERTSEGAHAQVIALKRHPAVRVALADFAGWKPPRSDDKLPRARLLHLFGDRERLARIVSASKILPERAIAAVLAHTRAQFESTTERAHRHVDADRLVALDGRALDAGTPMEDAHTFDAEDVPVLFELARRGAIPAAKLPRYDHIVVDEAQLRAPMELAAIADALVPGGTITLDGDHRQATDETAYFTGWAAARAELPATMRWAEATLSITYRSVPAIAELARGISTGHATLPTDPPADPAVWASARPGGFAQAAALSWHLDAVLARDPWRQIAIVARTPEHARRLHAELRGVDATLVLDGAFDFTPGAIVTIAAAVAGLEFDGVVIPDLTPAFYPATPVLARSLYVAATRARDWLWLLTPGAWSPLVTPAPIG